MLSFLGIYEVFLGHKNFAIGKQPDLLAGTETVSNIYNSVSIEVSKGKNAYNLPKI